MLSALISRIHKAKLLDLDELQLWGSGKVKREFLFSDDLADLCLNIINLDKKDIDMIINVGSGDEYTIKSLSSKIAKLIGFKGKIKWDTNKPDGVKRKLLSSSRAHKLGWRNMTNFDEGLKKPIIGF